MTPKYKQNNQLDIKLTMTWIEFALYEFFEMFVFVCLFVWLIYITVHTLSLFHRCREAKVEHVRCKCKYWEW